MSQSNYVRGNYLYDLTTGRVIGARKNVNTEGKTSGYGTINISDGKGNWGDETSHASFDILGDGMTDTINTYYACKNHEISYGGVESLSIGQLIDLFLSGNLIASELKIGLEAKGATNINIKEDGSMTIATFSLNGKEYTLSCATEAAASQLDEVTVDDYWDNLNVIMNNEHIRLYDEQRANFLRSNYKMGDERTIGIGQYLDVDRSDLIGGVIIDTNNPLCPQETVEYYLNMQANFCLTYFGYQPTEKAAAVIDCILTAEQREFVLEHPEIFHYTTTSAYYNTGELKTEAADPYAKLDYFGLFPDAVVMAWIMDTFKEMNLYLSWEVFYCDGVERFKNSIGDGSLPPIKQLQLDGNTVSWNQDTVDAFYDYLHSSKDTTTFQNQFGLSPYSSKEEIAKKLEIYFRACGSEDGKSLHIEDYYNSLEPFVETYDECIKNRQNAESDFYDLASRQERLYNKHGGCFNPADFQTKIAEQQEANNSQGGPDGSVPTSVNGVFVKSVASEKTDVYVYDGATNSYKKYTVDMGINYIMRLINLGDLNGSTDPTGLTPLRLGDLKDNTEILALKEGYNQTSMAGIYEKEGVFYKVTDGKFVETTLEVDNITVYQTPETANVHAPGQTNVSGVTVNYIIQDPPYSADGAGRNRDDFYIHTSENGIDLLKGVTTTPDYEDVPTKGYPEVRYTDADVRALKDEALNLFLRAFELADINGDHTDDKYNTFKGLFSGILNINNKNVGSSTVTFDAATLKSEIVRWILEGVKRVRASYQNGVEKELWNQGLCTYEMESTFGCSYDDIVFKLIFGEYPQTLEHGLEEAYFDKLEATAYDDNKLNAAVEKLFALYGLGSNGGTISLEELYDNMTKAYGDKDNGIFHTDEYFVFMAKLKNFGDDAAQIYPELSNRMGDFLPIYWRNGTDGYYHFSYDIDAMLLDGNCSFTMQALRLAAGVTDSDKNSDIVRKISRLLARIQGCEEKSNIGDYKIDIFKVAQYLLGKNPEGVNYYATIEAVEQAIADQTNDVNDFLHNYDTEHAEVHVKSSTMLQHLDLLPEGAVKTSIDGVFVTDAGDGYFRIDIWNNETETFDTCGYGSYVSTRGMSLETAIKNIESAIKSGSLYNLTASEGTQFVNGQHQPVLRHTLNNDQDSFAFVLLYYGLNVTSEKGVYEKNGHFYTYNRDFNVTTLPGNFNKLFTEVTRNLPYDYEYDPSVPITTDAELGSPVTPLTEAEVKEIYDYLGSITADIYKKYCQRAGTGYVYFGVPEDGRDTSYWYNPGDDQYGDYDSTRYGKSGGYMWKRTEDRDACFAAFNALVPQILEKFGDKIKTLMFDGEKFVIYTTDGSILCNYSDGDGNYIGMHGAGWFEPCCDRPISYTNVVVYDTPVPDKLPVAPDGGTLLKTQFEGILVSTTGNTYIWNAKQQTYVRSYFVNGIDALLGNTPGVGQINPNNKEQYALTIAIVWGYQQTSSPNIFYKNGKYYSIDVGNTYQHFTVIAAMKETDFFTEIDINTGLPVNSGNQGGSSTGSNPKQTSVIKQTFGNLKSDIKTSSVNGTKTLGAKTGNGVLAAGNEQSLAKPTSTTASAPSVGKKTGLNTTLKGITLGAKSGNGVLGAGLTGMDHSTSTTNAAARGNQPAEVQKPEEQEVNIDVNDTETDYNKDNIVNEVIEKYKEQLSEIKGGVLKFSKIVSLIADRLVDGEITRDEFDELAQSVCDDIVAAENAKVEVHEETVTADECTKKRNELAKKLGLIESRKGNCVYYSMSSTGARTYYMYDPEKEKFVEIKSNNKNVKTPEMIRQEAIIKAQQMGLSFTANFPWVCRKDDVIYRYNQNTGEYVESYTAYKPE